tara:strand:- start:684 stop:899 length:216 start_codon:yes stop_codon:yes gene_type:complete
MTHQLTKYHSIQVVNIGYEPPHSWHINYLIEDSLTNQVYKQGYTLDKSQDDQNLTANDVVNKLLEHVKKSV